jgi:tetratricopeptide (TPR) repeat protein
MRISAVLDLLAKVDEYLDAFQPDLALNFCKKALDMEPNNPIVLQSIASVYIELGEINKAEEHLQKAIQIEPGSGYEKFLALGQISGAQTALNLYKRGAKIFQSENSVYDLTQNEIQHKLASILCSQAELFLTDLCMETNAEEQCEKLLLEAKKICIEEPEVYGLLSDLRLAQCRDNDAIEEILNCINLFRDKDPNSLDYPSFDLRSSLARNCIELQLYQDAFDLLLCLVEEDDEHLLNLYLLALACYNLGFKSDCLDGCSILLTRLKKAPDVELTDATLELQEKSQALDEEMNSDSHQTEDDK